MQKTLKQYISTQKIWMLVSALATILAYGALSTTNIIRMDTDVFSYDPQNMIQSWFGLGRFGLVWTKYLLFLQTYHPIRSGITFCIFMILSMLTIGLYLYRFSKQANYPYWIFYLLYGTSQIWAFQVYFILQEAEIAFMCWIMALTAGMLMKTFFENEKKTTQLWKSIVGCFLLFIGFGTYQSFVFYFITVCVILFVCMSYHADENPKYLAGVCKLIAVFLIAMLAYSLVAKLFFLGNGSYLSDQMKWGKISFIDCLKEIKYEIISALKFSSFSNFSCYTLTVFLFFGISFVIIKNKKDMSLSQKLWFLIALCAVMIMPFSANIVMGSLVVARMQFCMQVVAAFLPFFAYVVLHSYWKKVGNIILYTVCILFVLAQIGINLAFFVTDQWRYQEDARYAQMIASNLEHVDVTGKKVIVLGMHRYSNDANPFKCGDYGISFFEWGNTLTPPDANAKATIRALKSFENLNLDYDYTDEMLAEAIELGRTMQSLPKENAILDAGDYVIIKLSEY